MHIDSVNPADISNIIVQVTDTLNNVNFEKQIFFGSKIWFCVENFWFCVHLVIPLVLHKVIILVPVMLIPVIIPTLVRILLLVIILVAEIILVIILVAEIILVMLRLLLVLPIY